MHFVSLPSARRPDRSHRGRLRVDVTGASTADGAPAELWTCNGQSSQQWKLG